MPSDGKSSHCLWQGELKKIILNPGYIDINITIMFGLYRNVMDIL
jgi:hypothetical protein